MGDNLQGEEVRLDGSQEEKEDHEEGGSQEKEEAEIAGVPSWLTKNTLQGEEVRLDG